MRGPRKFRVQRKSRDKRFTRRDLLERTAWIIAASAVPLTQTLASDPVSAVMIRLSTYMGDAGNRSLPSEDVQQVLVRVATHEASIVDNRDIPDICLQHMLAVMIINETVIFVSAHEKQRMSDPSVLDVRAKVQLVPDEELDRRLPRREAIVEVTLKNGTRSIEHVEAVRGTAKNPMTRNEVVAKCRNLMAPVLGKEKCASLVQKIMNLESVKNIAELRPLLQRNEPAS